MPWVEIKLGFPRRGFWQISYEKWSWTWPIKQIATVLGRKTPTRTMDSNADVLEARWYSPFSMSRLPKKYFQSVSSIAETRQNGDYLLCSFPCCPLGKNCTITTWGEDVNLLHGHSDLITSSPSPLFPPSPTPLSTVPPPRYALRFPCFLGIFLSRRRQQLFHTIPTVCSSSPTLRGDWRLR